MVLSEHMGPETVSEFYLGWSGGTLSLSHARKRFFKGEEDLEMEGVEGVWECLGGCGGVNA